jgi:hypothetical protein
LLVEKYVSVFSWEVVDVFVSSDVPFTDVNVSVPERDDELDAVHAPLILVSLSPNVGDP